MKTNDHARRVSGRRAAALRNSVIALLAAATLAGCASNTGRVRNIADPAHPIDRFVLAGSGGEDAGVDRDSAANPIATAAGGAVAGPGLLLAVIGHTGMGAQLATASVLGPLAAVGLVAGLVRGAAISAEIRRTHGPSLDALERQFPGLARQHVAEEAVAGHLAERFGERFAGTMPLSDRPVEGTNTTGSAVDSAFELGLRRVEMKIDTNGEVTLIVTASLRLLRLPGRRVLHEDVLRYASPEPLSPAYLSMNDGARARDEIEQAWRRFADEIGAVVDGAATGAGIPSAPLPQNSEEEIDT